MCVFLFERKNDINFSKISHLWIFVINLKIRYTMNLSSECNLSLRTPRDRSISTCPLLSSKKKVSPLVSALGLSTGRDEGFRKTGRRFPSRGFWEIKFYISFYFATHLWFSSGRDGTRFFCPVDSSIIVQYNLPTTECTDSRRKYIFCAKYTVTIKPM